jgi:hypothetical protein
MIATQKPPFLNGGLTCFFIFISSIHMGRMVNIHKDNKPVDNSMGADIIMHCLKAHQPLLLKTDLQNRNRTVVCQFCRRSMVFSYYSSSYLPLFSCLHYCICKNEGGRVGVCPSVWKKSLVPSHSLFLPGVTIHMVAVFLPESRHVFRGEFNAPEPFGALPKIQMRYYSS